MQDQLPDAVGEGDNVGSKNLVVASMPAQKVEDISSVCDTTALPEGEMYMDDDTTASIGSIEVDAGCSDTGVAGISALTKLEDAST